MSAIRVGDKWHAYSRTGGKKVYVGSFDSKRAATEAADDHAARQRAIVRGELPPESNSKLSFDDAVEQWLDSLKARKARAHVSYKASTRSYLKPTFGTMLLAAISSAEIMDWRDELSTRFAPATVNGALIALSSAFTYFAKRGWVAKNPARGVEHIETPDRAYEWVRTREDITKLLLECPRGIREIATVAVCTGLRLDELLHLHWSDVDLERRLITVHRGRQGTVKSGKQRHVPILDTLLPFVRELALKRAGAVLVFPGRADKPRTKPGVWYPFKMAAKRAGMPKLRVHDLRHTFASHWVLDGGDIFRLSKILGHSSVVITQRVYAHLIPEAWEQDYRRVSFTLPESGAVYGITKRKLAAV